MKNCAKNELAIVRIFNIPQACPENKVQTSEKSPVLSKKCYHLSFIIDRFPSEKILCTLDHLGRQILQCNFYEQFYNKTTY